MAVRRPVTLPEGVSISQAAAALRRSDVSAALVGADAIVSERDLARAWSEGFDGSEPVSRVATNRPVTVDGRMAITEATSIMLNHAIRHLVVVMPDATRTVGTKPSARRCSAAARD